MRPLPGFANSGRVRYAAAMYFYQRRMISEDILEVYRACSKNDLIDPKSQDLNSRSRSASVKKTREFEREKRFSHAFETGLDGKQIAGLRPGLQGVRA